MALNELRYLCQKSNVYWTTSETEAKSSNDDVTLLYEDQLAFDQKATLLTMAS